MQHCLSDWISFHHLKGDPFSAQPLQSGDDFQYLFVKTADITRHVDPIADHFLESKPRLTVICGERGMGKSTCLYYISDRLSAKRVLTISVSEQPALVEKLIDPVYGVGADTLFQILSKLLGSLTSKHPELLDAYRVQFDEIAEAIGFDLEHRIPSGTKTPTAGLLFSKLEQLCSVMKSEKVRSLISIDNYDRLDAELAIRFLKSNQAQPVFELLQRAGATVLLTAKSEWLAGSLTELSYLGKPLILNPLNPGESKILVTKRIANWLEEGRDAKAIFEDDALEEICVSKKGIPRDVLELARACLIRAAQKSSATVTAGIVEQVLHDEEFSIAKFYTAISNDKAARAGLARLDRLRQNQDYAVFKEAIDAIIAVHESREPKPEMIEVLGPAGIFSRIPIPENPSKTRLVLDQFVDALLWKIDENEMLPDFVEWFTRVPTADIVPVASPKQRETREELQDSLNNLRQKIVQSEALRILNETSTGYEALLFAVQNEDYDAVRLLGKVRSVLLGAATLAYFLHATLVLQNRGVKTPNEITLRDFLLREGFEKDVVSFSTLLQTCQLVSLGAPYDLALTPSTVSETERLLGVFLRYCVDAVAKAISTTKLPLTYTDSIDEISKRLAPRIKADSDKFFLIYYDRVPFAKFLIIGWPTRDRVLARVYGEAAQTQTQYKELDPYVFNVPWLPNFIDRMLVNRTIAFRFGLSFYNSYELAKCLSILAAHKQIVAEFISPESTSVMRLAKRLNGYGFSLDPILAPRFGTPISEPEQIVARTSRTIKMDPNNPYQSLMDFEGLMKKMEGEVIIVDMFLDEAALPVIRCIQPGQVTRMNVLTSTSHLSENFKVLARAFCEEFRRKGCETEFRVVDEGDTKEIHDRYIIDSKSAYDIPPISVGWKKLSHIKDIEDDREDTLALLQKYWARARLLDKAAISRPVPKTPAIRVTDAVLKRIGDDVSLMETDTDKLESSMKMLSAVGKTMPSARYAVRLQGIKTNMVTLVKRKEGILKEVSNCLENTDGSYTQSDIDRLLREKGRLESVALRLEIVQQGSKKLG